MVSRRCHITRGWSQRFVVIIKTRFWWKIAMWLWLPLHLEWASISRMCGLWSTMMCLRVWKGIIKKRVVVVEMVCRVIVCCSIIHRTLRSWRSSWRTSRWRSKRLVVCWLRKLRHLLRVVIVGVRCFFIILGSIFTKRIANRCAITVLHPNQKWRLRKNWWRC